MEAIYLITHVIILACAVCVVYVSFSSPIDANEIAMPTIVSSLVEKVRSLQITTADLYRTATALFALFLRS